MYRPNDGASNFNSTASCFCDSPCSSNKSILLGDTSSPDDPLDSAATWAREGINAAIAKGFVPADIQGDYTKTITLAEFCRIAVKFVEYKTGKSIDAILAEKGVVRDPNAFSDVTNTDILAAYALDMVSTAAATGNLIPKEVSTVSKPR